MKEENVMKKFLSLLFVVIVLTLALTLSACTGDNSQSTKKQDPPAHEHVIVIDEAIEATCFSTGLTKGKHCSVCNRIFLAQRVINRISHTEVIDEAVPATCTTTGLTKGKHCSVCSKVLVAQEIIPAYNHSFGVWNNISSPNDNINITEQRSCSCGFTETRTYPIEGSKGLEYQINSDGKSCTVIGIGSCLDSGIAIPNTVDGYTVTSIGEEAFSGQSDITFIIIPNTVTSIGTKAFYGCVGLKDMTIPASVTSIGTQIFQKALLTKSINNSKSSISFKALVIATALSLVIVSSSLENKHNLIVETATAIFNVKLNGFPHLTIFITARTNLLIAINNGIMTHISIIFIISVGPHFIKHFFGIHFRIAGQIPEINYTVNCKSRIVFTLHIYHFLSLHFLYILYHIFL